MSQRLRIQVIQRNTNTQSAHKANKQAMWQTCLKYGTPVKVKVTRECFAQVKGKVFFRKVS